jgi:CubicO group peptidase (beta-lactamase class C family)
LGIKRVLLEKIDTIVQDAIRRGAMPGCQVLAAKGNNIFFQKSYGKAGWADSLPALQAHAVYDLASITKIAASALALMRLETEGRLSVDSPVRTYLPETAESNKGNLILKQILAHQAGLVAWIPFWRNFFSDGKPLSGFFCDKMEEDYPYRVAEGMYAWKGIPDSIWTSLLQSGLSETGKYLYSDLGYYLVRRIVERLSGQPFENFLEETFYQPLGLVQTGFRPREWAESSVIVPTENDREFRFQLLSGDVHDQGAALLGGVSGHAGLFGTAYELALLMRMVATNGEYGGHYFLNPAVIQQFTGTPFPGNRRGICFDKAENNPANPPVTATSSSTQTFGHTGFTGTCVWYDPANELLYVFLSNRVHPNAENKKLSDLKVRGRIQEVLNEALRDIQL